MIDLGIDIDPKTMVLVVSDIHLGALHTEISLFNLFLSSLKHKLESKALPNLKALIILGDCFDLIMDTYDDLLNFALYKEIYDKFEYLNDKDGFRLIFALGNHEISVVGDYSNSFATNTNNMLTEFNNQMSELNLNYSFFNKSNFTQFVLVEQENKRSDPLFYLLDREKDILNAPTSDLNNYLMAHGFQFDPGLHFWSGLWDMALHNPFRVIKKIGDGIWNGFLKNVYEKSRKLAYYIPDKIEKMKKDISKAAKTYNKKKNNQLNSTNKVNLEEDLNNKQQSELHREAIRNNEGCINNIVNFVPRFIDAGIPINHVIYGHTHDRLRPIPKEFRRQIEPNQAFQFKIMMPEILKSEFWISNTGAWQHVKKPSFIEIHKDWQVKPKVVPLELKVEKIIDR